jgi:DNA replicative helicase MCM subunit Mcm2 (Cdc46/Mcm family)
MEKRSDLLQDAKNFFEAHKKTIGESIREKERVVPLSFEDIAHFNPELSEKIIKQPEETLGLLETALAELEFQKNPRIRLIDLPKTAMLKIRKKTMIEIKKLVGTRSENNPAKIG